MIGWCQMLRIYVNIHRLVSIWEYMVRESSKVIATFLRDVDLWIDNSLSFKLMLERAAEAFLLATRKNSVLSWINEARFESSTSLMRSIQGDCLLPSKAVSFRVVFKTYCTCHDLIFNSLYWLVEYQITARVYSIFCYIPQCHPIIYKLSTVEET